MPGCPDASDHLSIPTPSGSAGLSDHENQGDRRNTHPLWLQKDPRPFAARRLADQSQAGIPALSAGRPEFTRQKQTQDNQPGQGSQC